MFRRQVALVNVALIAALIVLTLASAVVVPAPSASASVALSASLTASWPEQTSSSDTTTPAHPGDTITYTAKITNNSGADVSGIQYTDTVDPNTTVVASSVEASPIARPDSYSAYGNVPITIGTSTSTTGVLANDLDPDGDAVSITASDSTSTNGGTVSMTTSGPNAGGFTYTPPPGFDGTDTFHYTLGDGHGNTDIGTVSIAVSGMLWFIDNSQNSNGNGTLTSPFSSVANFDAVNDGGTNHPKTTDPIFLYDTSGNTYTGPLTLLSGQKVYGQGATQDVGTILSITLPPGSTALPTHGGTRSTIASASTNNAVNVNSGNTIRGFNLSDTGTGTALAMVSGLTTSYGTLTASEMTVSNTGGGAAINLGNSSVSGTLSALFGTVTATGGATNGIIIKNTTGTFESDGGSITGTTSDGAHFEGQSTSNPITVILKSMTFTGDDSSAASGSCSDFTGATCNAVVYLSNASSVNMTTDTLDGLNGSAHAQNGIYGSNVAGFTLSGGEIKYMGYPSNTSSGCPSAPVCDIESGILFSNLTGTSSITTGNIHDSAANDLEVRNNVAGPLNLSVSSTTLGAIGNGTNTNDSGNSAIKFIADGASTPVMNLDLEGNQMGSSTTGLDGYGLFATDASTTTASNAHMNFTVGRTSGNHIWLNGIAGVGLHLDQAGAGGHTTFDFENNDIHNSGSNDITINLADNPAGGNNGSGTSIGGSINNNTIGTSGVAQSAGKGVGIALFPNNVGAFTVSVTNNQIYGTGGVGIEAQAVESPTSNITIKNNTVDVDNQSDHDVLVQNGVSTGGNTATMCADVSGNQLKNTAGFTNHFGLNLLSIATSAVVLPGYSGMNSTSDTSSVVSFESGQNTFDALNTTRKVRAVEGSLSSPATNGFVGGSACATPPSVATTFRLVRKVRTADLRAVVSDRGLQRGLSRHIHVSGRTGRAVTRSASKPHTHASLRPLDKSVINGTVTINNFTLPGGHTETITFQVTVNAAITANSVSTSGTVTWSGNSIGITTNPATTPIQINTSATLVSSLNPSNLGQQVTFTDTITNTEASGIATPTGTVQFKDGGTNLGSAVTLSGSGSTATATYSTSSLTLGNHTITADFVPTTGTGFQIQTGTAMTANGNIPGNPQKVIGPDLSITKTADASTISAGDAIGYTITLSNAADGATATAPTITDTLPSGTGLNWSVDKVNGAAPPNPSPCAITAQALSCTFGDLAASSSDSIHLTSPTTKDSCPGPYTNQATGGASNTNLTVQSGTASVAVDCPSLSITKTADASAVSAGTGIGFTVSVSNSSASGTGTGHAVQVSDPLPPGPANSDVSWSIAAQSNTGACSVGGSAGAQTLSCLFTSMAPGATATVHITSSTSYADCGPYANTATLSASNQASSTASDTTTVLCPSLTITKTADAATVNAGDGIGYTITVSNASGNTVGTASSVTLSDTLPTGTGLNWTIASQPTGNPCTLGTTSPQALSCNFGTMAPGASNAVHLTSVTTAGSCADYSNSASVSAGNAPTISDHAAISVQCPQLTVTKKADNQTVAAGSPMGFVITASNASGTTVGTARSVTITDPLPGGTGVTWSIASQTIAQACAISTTTSQTLTCSFGDLAASTSGSVHITSNTQTGSCGQYANTATMSATNIAASTTASDTINVGCAALTLTKIADAGTVSTGDAIGYTLAVGNTGPQTATAPTLTDTLPSGTGLTWTIASQPSGNPSPCSISGTGTQTLSCTFSDLAANATPYSVHITSPTPSSGCTTYTNSASATAANSPQATAQASIVVQCPGLSISKIADSDTVSAGTSIGYTISYGNSNATGAGTAHTVAISDPLPPGPSGSGVTWSIDTQSTGNHCSITGSAGSQTLNCTLGTLAPNDSGSVHVTSTTGAASCGPYANTASLSAANATTITSSATITVECPVLSITKKADSATVSAGDGIGYTVTVKNSNASGTGTATGVSVSDPLPAGSGVSWSIDTQSNTGACTISGTSSQTLNCTFDSMAANTTKSVHVTSTTRAASCGAYANTATLTATNMTGTKTASDTTTVQCPSLSVSKKADNATVSAGDGIGYTITVGNANTSGTGIARGVTVNDPLPAGPSGSGVTWSIDTQSNTGACTISGTSSQTLNCTFGDMNPNASANVHIMSGTSGASCGDYNNTATLSATNIAASLTSSAKTTVQCPALTFSKTADSATVPAGSPMGYVITAKNASTAGTGIARAVGVTDPLPPGPSGSGVSWSIESQTIAQACAIGGTAGNQSLTCAFGDLNPGSSGSVHITSATQNASCADYANTATFTATNISASKTASATITVGCAALTLSKTPDSGTVSAGTAIGYSLVVGNTGPQAATSTALSDTLPTGSGISWSIASQPAGNPSPCVITGTNSQVLNCTLGTVAESATDTVHITSPTTAASCTTYANSANATATNSPKATAQASITVQCPSLSVSKTADHATVSAGEAIGFVVKASNASASGTGTAAGTSLSDPLPSGAGVSWSIASQPTGNPCSISGTSAQTLSCPLGSMAPGATASVHVTSNTAGSSCKSYANTATLSASNVTSSLTASDTTTVQCPSLTATKAADSATVSAGTSIGFSIGVSNASASGTGTAKSVGIADPLPAGPSGSGVSWSIASQSSGNHCSISGSAGSQTLTCSFGNLAPGGADIVHVTSATGAASCGSYANTATMTASNAATQTPSATTVVQCPKLTASKAADAATVNAGSQVGFSITVSNANTSGTGTASSVAMSDPLSGGAGVSWSIASQPSGNPSPCALGGAAGSQSLTCSFGAMTPGASNVVRLTGTTNGATCGALANTATVSAGNIPASLTASATVTIQCPSLSVKKTAESTAVSAGATIGYVITAANASTAGTGTATGAALSDPLPSGTGVSWSIASQPTGNPCSITGTSTQTLSCTLGSMAAGASASVHVTSGTTASSCTNYANTATLSATNVPHTLTAAATITVNCPHLTLTKTADKASVNAGSPIGFTIKVGNTGQGTSSSTMLSDPLPTGAGVSWSVNPAVTGCAITAGTLSCALGTVAPAAATTVHMVSATTANSCATYVNTASLSASNNPTLTALASLSVMCPTSTLYTGTQAVVIGGAVTLSATVSGGTPCTSSGTVTFALDRNPASGSNPFPSGAPVSGGTATGATLNTASWAAGVYTLTATYSGPAYCAGSSDQVTLTVGQPGTAARIAIGLGKYTAPNSTTPYTIVFTYSGGKGTIQLSNGSSWGLKGTLSQLVKAGANDGAASGVGTLTYGSTTLTNIPFTISFHANTGQNTFGIHINYTPTGSQPALPNSAPRPMSAGVIHLS